MRLKKIKIHGFKSFSEPTTIDVIDGITAIVGPNGCGKSNISDALRWVLGEQSAKSLRGGKMQDIIFAGTSKKKPLNIAEVSLTLTDIQEALPIDYEEVTVTRRLHRSGESEYFINKNRVRLREVQSLFLDSGIGKSAFSIFEQGKIDQVIHMSPYERRSLFEEAAGILRFLKRKQEALNKLTATEQNMQRLGDVLSEIDSQLEVLEEQSKKARLFKEQKNAIGVLEKGLLIAQWDTLSSKIQEHIKGQKELNQQLELLQTTLSTSREQIDQTKGTLEKNQIKTGQQREQLVKLEGQKKTTETEISGAQESLRELESNRKRWKNQAEALLNEQRQRKVEIGEIKAELELVQGAREKQEEQVKSLSGEVRTQEKATDTLRKKLNRLQQEQLKAIQLQGREESELMRCETQIQELEKHLKTLEERLEQQAESKVIASKEKENCLKALEACVKEIALKEKVFQEAKKSVQKAEETLKNELKTKEQENEKLRLLTARQQILLKLKNEYEGFSTGGKKLLDASSTPENPIYELLTPLYTFFKMHEGSEELLAKVMCPYQETLVVETHSDREKVLNYAQSHQITDFSLFCLSDCTKPKSKKIPKNSLAGLVDEGVAARHFLENFSIADVSTDRSSVSTTEPQWIDHFGVMHIQSKRASNPFSREAELAELELLVKKATKNVEKIDQSIQAAEEVRQNTKKQQDCAEADVRRLEMKRIEANYALQNANKQVEKFERDEKTAQEELSRLKTEIKKKTESSKISQTKLKEVKKSTELIVVQIKDCENESTQYTKNKNDFLLKLKKEKTSLESILDKQRALSHTVSLLTVKDQESDIQIKRLHSELEQGDELEAKMKQRLKDWETLILDTEKEIKETSQIALQIEEQLKQNKARLCEQEAALKKMSDEKSISEKKLHELEISLTQKKSVQASVSAEFLKEYDAEIADYDREKAPLKLSQDKARKEIASLKAQLEDEDLINMAAIGEFEKQKQRHTFIHEQMDDLLGSKKELLEVISHLDTKSRELFKVTFEEIREHFQKNFETLFNGGEADIQLIGSEDLLEAGVEIVAKPPGKKMQSIQLLSGGEKCLTAMALLFAFFEVKPAPFCILDEIDAPLDDSNIARFVEVLKNFTDRCQFLIVTHNKRTMSIADVLVGVSMQERGVSKVVSLDFARPKELLPA